MQKDSPANCLSKSHCRRRKQAGVIFCYIFYLDLTKKLEILGREVVNERRIRYHVEFRGEKGHVRGSFRNFDFMKAKF